MATRRELVRAALELFDANGFEATSVEEISAAVGASVRTFYRYFESKEDVLRDEARMPADELRERLADRREDESLLHFLCKIFVNMAQVRDVEIDRELMQLRARVFYASPTLLASFVAYEMEMLDVIEEAVAEELGMRARHDVLPRYIAGAMFGMVVAVRSAWTESGDLGKRLEESFSLLEADLASHMDNTARLLVR